MDKDDFYDNVIEMGRDIRYMRDDISDLKRELEENVRANAENAELRDARILHLEEVQNLNTGKLAVILILIGAGIVGIFQFLLMLWDKIPK